MRRLMAIFLVADLCSFVLLSIVKEFSLLQEIDSAFCLMLSIASRHQIDSRSNTYSRCNQMLLLPSLFETLITCERFQN